MAEVRVRVRRAYEESEPGDGARVLVDRISAARTDQSQGGAR